MTSRAPLGTAAREALLVALDAGWADPTRLYGEARQSQLLLDAAKESIAVSLGVRADEISFTPSVALARRRAVGGLVPTTRHPGPVVTSAVEHSTIIGAAQAFGQPMVEVGVDSFGQVDPDDFLAACRPETTAACLQVANQEVGTLQPVEAVSTGLAMRGIPLVCDASAAAGYVDIPPVWSVLTAAPESFGGPSGIGILAVRTGVRWNPSEFADESASVPLATAAAIALEESSRQAAQHGSGVNELVNLLRTRIAAEIPDCHVVGHPIQRLPHVVTLTCMYVDGETLVRELDREGFSVASGSACVAEDLLPSHVLAAMGALTHGNLRIGLPWDVTRADVERFMVVLPQIVAEARGRLL
jgi:cysteine desulfurase